MSRGKNPHPLAARKRIHQWDLTGSAPRAPKQLDYADIKKALERLPILAERPEQVGMISLVGSHGYGLAHKDSDLDFRGFYIPPSTELWGLKKPAEQIEAKEPDFTLFEVGKFCRLAAAANPNVIEIFWADAVWDTQDGKALRDIRDSFLSQKIRQTYGGYAQAQFKLALSGGRDHLYLKRRHKAIRHLFRLYEQGYEMLTTGNLTYRLADPERIRALSLLDDASLEREYKLLDEKFKQAASDLPLEADTEKINEALIEIRRRHLK
jgi:predicted nucleotidyltransferase